MNPPSHQFTTNIPHRVNINVLLRSVKVFRLFWCDVEWILDFVHFQSVLLWESRSRHVGKTHDAVTLGNMENLKHVRW